MSRVRIQREAPAGDTGGGPQITLPSMNPALNIPHVDEALIRHLMGVFRVSVSDSYSLREYDAMVGQQQVIAHLRNLLEMQNKE